MLVLSNCCPCPRGNSEVSSPSALKTPEELLEFVWYGEERWRRGRKHAELVPILFPCLCTSGRWLRTLTPPVQILPKEQAGKDIGCWRPETNLFCICTEPREQSNINHSSSAISTYYSSCMFFLESEVSFGVNHIMELPFKSFCAHAFYLISLI